MRPKQHTLATVHSLKQTEGEPTMFAQPLMMIRLLAVTACLIFAAATAPAAVVQPDNASFENPDNDGSPSFPAPTDWTTFGNLGNLGVIDQANSNIPNAFDGTQWVFLTEGTGPGGIVSSNIGPAIGGATYTISFGLGQNMATTATPPDSLDVILQTDVNFIANINPSLLVPNGGDTAATSVDITLPNTENGKSLSLIFRVEASSAGSDDQILLDNVSVAIPEPASFAMLGAAALMLVRRRRHRG